MLTIKNWPIYGTIVLSTLSLCGCATERVIAGACPQAPEPTPAMLVPAPPPGIFSQCLREIIKGEISDPCLTFLREKPTP